MPPESGADNEFAQIAARGADKIREPAGKTEEMK
jgi:hypothetical protein